MLTFIFAGLILVSIAVSVFTGTSEQLTEAVLTEPVNAVELCIYLCGGMCFWGGLMRIAERSGLTDVLAKGFSFILGGLFRDIDKNGRAFHAICMNITANLLGQCRHAFRDRSHESSCARGESRGHRHSINGDIHRPEHRFHYPYPLNSPFNTHEIRLCGAFGDNPRRVDNLGSRTCILPYGGGASLYQTEK